MAGTTHIQNLSFPKMHKFVKFFDMFAWYCTMFLYTFYTTKHSEATFPKILIIFSTSSQTTISSICLNLGQTAFFFRTLGPTPKKRPDLSGSVLYVCKKMYIEMIKSDSETGQNWHCFGFEFSRLPQRNKQD